MNTMRLGYANCQFLDDHILALRLTHLARVYAYNPGIRGVCHWLAMYECAGLGIQQPEQSALTVALRHRYADK